METETKQSRLDKFHSELMDDVKLLEQNLHDRTLGAPAIKTKWIRISFEEKKLLKRLHEHKKVKVAEYITAHGQKDIPKLKTDAEAVKSNEVQKITAAIETQQEVVDYLEQIIKVVLSNFSFDIKNSLDIVKLENN
jgi:hypothetical protein